MTTNADPNSSEQVLAFELAISRVEETQQQHGVVASVHVKIKNTE
jgi:hypothetical protein